MQSLKKMLIATILLVLPFWPISCKTTGAYEGGNAHTMGQFNGASVLTAWMLAGLLALISATAIVALHPTLRTGLRILAAGGGLFGLFLLMVFFGLNRWPRNSFGPETKYPGEWVINFMLPLLAIGTLVIAFHTPKRRETQ